MARRGGKAANRQSRQRRAQRAAQARSAGPRPTPAAPAPDSLLGPSDEAVVSSSAAASVSTPSRRSAASRAVGVPSRLAGAGTSRLSERAVAEYHYVQRDLRNIGVLVLALAILLIVAAVVANLLGIGRAG